MVFDQLISATNGGRFAFPISRANGTSVESTKSATNGGRFASCGWLTIWQSLKIDSL